MRILWLNSILTILILAYCFSAFIFLLKQKQGASFASSFDKAIAMGGIVFISGSGLVSTWNGNLVFAFI